MIRHLLKLMWNERRINGWIFLEYVCVFCILWFCVDFLGYMGKKYLEPMGYNLENVYEVRFQRMDDAAYKEKTGEEVNEYEIAMTFIDRIRLHPDVVNVSISAWSAPYSGNSSMSSYFINSDSISHGLRQRRISDGFFDVFQVDFTGRFVFENGLPGQVMISSNNKGIFGETKTGYKVEEIRELQESGWDNANKVVHQVVGYTGPLKDTFYGETMSGIFLPMKPEDLNLSWNEIMIRVRPDVGKDFGQRFRQEMRDQLAIGPYRLVGIVPMEELQSNLIKNMGIIDSLNSTYAITLFVILNIFLGVIGTFWYRTQSRQGEIGLRMSLGATQAKIKKMLFTETFLLVFTSSLIGLVICLHIAQTDILDALGLPSSSLVDQSKWAVHMMDYLLTFLFLLFVSLLAVWYPARQASKLQPVEALREE